MNFKGLKRGRAGQGGMSEEQRVKEAEEIAEATKKKTKKKSK